jgi:hypothetical protein
LREGECVFNLLVTCVGSKSREGPSIKDVLNGLLANGKRNDIDALFTEWKKVLTQQMAAPGHLTEARWLYKGPLWNASMDAFNKIKQPRNLWVISCGFGLINSGQMLSGYKATFKLRESDSLFDRNFFHGSDEDAVKRKWWNLLSQNGILDTSHPRSIHDLVNGSGPEDVVLVAAGKDYYEAIYGDLDRIDTSRNGPKMAFVGIKRLYRGFEPDVPEKLKPFIQSYSDGIKLREFLGCGGIQIHSKSAEFLIDRYYKTGELKYEFP